MNVPSEVEALITDAPVSAHVATSVDDRPHVAPVWYGYRDNTVYFQTGGRKLENVRRNPRVALSIESAHNGDVDWNVTLLGRATIIDDPETVTWADNWIYDKYDRAKADGGEYESDSTEYTNYGLIAVAVGSVSWNVY